MSTRGEFIRYLVSATIICMLAAVSGTVAATAPKGFPSPDAAVKALQAALEAKDAAAIREIFGPEMEVLRCADLDEDVEVMQFFGKAMGQMCNLVFRTGDIAVLYVGAENYPFPIPLVYKNQCWRFDTAAGLEEVLARRIGTNELAAIETCRKYRRAQLEYAQADVAGDGKSAFAQRFISDADTRNGLDAFWPVTTVSLASDMAETEICTPGNPGESFVDNGYVFVILKAQGPAAPGGRRSYIVDGDMVGGFALAAYPACYGTSGLMSFQLGPDGRLYERCLGEKTESWGATVSEFNPDEGWSVVED